MWNCRTLFNLLSQSSSAAAGCGALNTMNMSVQSVIALHGAHLGALFGTINGSSCRSHAALCRAVNLDVAGAPADACGGHALNRCAMTTPSGVD
jgi:hypothetical protein